MNANIISRTIELTKTEAKAAGRVGTNEFEELKQLRAEYPDFRLAFKASPKRKNDFKGLTYDFMKTYIEKHDDENHSIMNDFNTLTAKEKDDDTENLAYIESASYKDVKKWFLAKFPEIATQRDAHKQKVQDILAKVSA